MLDNRLVIHKEEIRTLEIDTDNQGLKIAWNYIRGRIVRGSPLAVIIFQDQSVLDSRGIGGFFTQNSLVDVLYLSKNLYDDKAKKIHFKNENDAAIFIHECSHYLHIVGAKGKFTQKDVDDVKNLVVRFPVTPVITYWAEREAWQLSLNMNEVFKMNMKEAIDEVNATNMINVEMSQGLRKSMGHAAVKRWSQKLHIEDFKHVKSV